MGEKTFVREDYWKNFPVPNERLLFDKNYTKSFFLDSEDHEQIKKVAKQVLYGSLHPQLEAQVLESVSFSQVLDEINQTTSLKVNKNLETFHQIERWLVGMLRKKGLLEGIVGIEFPVNLRAVHGKPPANYLQREYATDYYHSDIWSGEPQDIIIGFIYLEGDVEGTSLELYDVEKERVEIFEKKLDKYTTLDTQSAQGTLIDYTPQKGQIILFDGVCPHRTKRGNGKARISLDFRLRRANPYLDLEGWHKNHAPWSRYWFLHPHSAATFAERAQQELELLEKHNLTVGLAERKRWLEQALSTI